MNNCRSCDAEIIWTITESGKRMPVDAEPVSGGNVRLAGTAASVLGPLEVLLNEGPLYVSHFATCRDADSHRKIIT